MSAPYIEIAGGYSYALLRVGMTVRNPAGREVYCQPGDDTAAMLANIEALEEIPDAKRATITAMTLGDYFDE